MSSSAAEVKGQTLLDCCMSNQAPATCWHGNCCLPPCTPRLYRDKETGALKGDGTVSYEDPFSAGSAVEWFNEKEWKGESGCATMWLTHQQCSSAVCHA